MASLRRLPNSRYWIACYYDSAGTRKQRSTKTVNKAEARKQAELYERPYRDRLRAGQLLAIMQEEYRKTAGADAPSLSLRAYAKKWLESKEPTVKESTYNSYAAKLQSFIEHMGPRADELLTLIEREDIEGWRNEQVGRLKAKTINAGIKSLRTFFKDARRARIAAENPAEFVQMVERKPGEKVEIRPFTLAQIKSILAAADDEWKSICLFALYTGQRLGDIATLTWSQIDLQVGSIKFTTQKTGKFIELPLEAPLREHIASLPAGDDAFAPVHPKAKAQFESAGNKSVTLSNQFSAILAAAGLREKTPHRKKATAHGRSGAKQRNPLCFHSFRHTATSIMKNAGIPAAVVQDYIGHDSAEMSKIYTTIDMESKRRAAQALPALSDLK